MYILYTIGQPFIWLGNDQIWYSAFSSEKNQHQNKSLVRWDKLHYMWLFGLCQFDFVISECNLQHVWNRRTSKKLTLLASLWETTILNTWKDKKTAFLSEWIWPWLKPWIYIFSRLAASACEWCHKWILSPPYLSTNLLLHCWLTVT